MTPNNFKPYLVFFLIVNFSFAQEIEEIISVASYPESNKLNASPVEVISAEEFKNLRVSTVAELSKYLSIASGSNFQTNALDGVRFPAAIASIENSSAILRRPAAPY